MDEKPSWDCPVEIISESQGYSFCCWYPQYRESVTDYQIYDTIALAEVAAHSFISWETVQNAIRHCYSAYRLGNLSPEEYFTLEDLILGVLQGEGESPDSAAWVRL